MGFFNSPDLHAGVRRFYDDSHPERMQGFLDAVADLLGKAFLDLKAAGIGFDDARNLAETGDAAVRNVCNVALPHERQHVVFAGGKKFDILYKDHLTVTFFKESLVYDSYAVFVIPFCQELQRFGDPFRGLDQALTLGILTQQKQYISHFISYLSCDNGIVVIFSGICHVTKIRIFVQLLNHFLCSIVFLYIFAPKISTTIMYWTLELASSLDDAPWPATKEELIDYAIRSGAPEEVIENLQELEEEGEIYEAIEDIWPDYPTKDDFFFNEEEY